MKTSLRLGLVLALAATVFVENARAEKMRASPHEDVSATISGKKVTISYGRPYKKNRDIFGALVPWTQVWRLGADEATTLTTDGDITIGDLKVPKGTYSLFAIPNQKDWVLVVNKTAKQWGAFKYDAKDDLGRTTLKVATAVAPVEQLTIALDPVAGNIKTAWDKTVATTTIK